MRNNFFKVFYTPDMVHEVPSDFFSKSPTKPRLFHQALVAALGEISQGGKVQTVPDFKPFDDATFELAHTKEYVNALMKGEMPVCESSGIKWGQSLADSVRLTNASLYEAILSSIQEPNTICVSPTSGFHHASPTHGEGFCTFSGQVIASTKLYRELGKVGAYVDLDAHFGNSIEDSREFVKDLNMSIPLGCNINPDGRTGKNFIKSLRKNLVELGKMVLDGKVDYVVFCHGADSHLNDDADSGVCATTEWLECSRIFYEWVSEIDGALGRPLPLTTALFGGYRQDRFSSVINLHVEDHVICSQILMK